MANGTARRETVNNPLEQSALGAAPKTRTGLSGIRTGQGTTHTDTGMQAAAQSLSFGAGKLREKQRTEEFISGQLAAHAGETEDELRARGGTPREMAGMVSMEVGNAMNAWHNQQVNDARINWSESTPEAYQDHLAKQSTALLDQIGGDAFARSQLAPLMAKSMGQLSQAHMVGHQEFVTDGVAREYGAGLSTSAQLTTTQVTQTTPGAVSNPNWQAVSESVAGNTIHHESRGDVNAQSKTSTAGGTGGFIDSTWLAMIKKHRPQLAAGKTNAEIIAMKKGKGSEQLSYDMTVAYGADNAAILSGAGLDVTPGTLRLSHFAGPGGATRLLKADPGAHVSAALTQKQIDANAFLKDWTVGQVVNWANKQAGQKTIPLKQQVLTNPGLPPERHRNEVLTAIMQGFQQDDASLFEGMGGYATLRELGITNAQMSTVMKGYDTYKDKELTAYSMEYERGADEIISLADDGELSEDEIYEKLDAFQQAHPRNDVEMRRLFNEVAVELKENEVGQGWNTPEGLAVLTDAREAMQGAKSTEEMQTVLEDLVEEGRVRGIDAELTANQLVSLNGAYDKAQNKKRDAAADRVKEQDKKIATLADAQQALGNRTLNKKDKKTQKAGMGILQDQTVQEVDALVTSGDLSLEQRNGEAQKIYAHKLVSHNVVDTELAGQMAAAVVDVRGWDLKGEMPDEAIAAYANFLEFTKGDRATAGYMERMFKDNPEALTFFYNAQAYDTGSADTTAALRTAARAHTDPVTQQAMIEKQAKMNADGFLEGAQAEFVKEAGLDGNWFQRTLGRWTTNSQMQADRTAVENDPRLTKFLDDATRRLVALTRGNITPEAAQQRSVGQAMNQGAAVLGNFLVAPVGETMHSMTGIAEGKGPEAINEAVQMGILNAFNTQLPESARKSIAHALSTQATLDQRLEAIDTSPTGSPDSLWMDAISAANFDIQAIPIEGDMQLFVTPTQATIDGWFSNPQDVDTLGMTLQFSLSEAGDMWNAEDQKPSGADVAINTLVDFFRPDLEPAPTPTQEEINALVNPTGQFGGNGALGDLMDN